MHLSHHTIQKHKKAKQSKAKHSTTPNRTAQHIIKFHHRAKHATAQRSLPKKQPTRKATHCITAYTTPVFSHRQDVYQPYNIDK